MTLKKLLNLAFGPQDAYRYVLMTSKALGAPKKSIEAQIIAESASLRAALIKIASDTLAAREREHFEEGLRIATDYATLAQIEASAPAAEPDVLRALQIMDAYRPKAFVFRDNTVYGVKRGVVLVCRVAGLAVDPPFRMPAAFLSPLLKRATSARVGASTVTINKTVLPGAPCAPSADLGSLTASPWEFVENQDPAISVLHVT